MLPDQSELPEEQETAYAPYSETDLENLYDVKEKENHEKIHKQTASLGQPRKKPKPQDDKPVCPERRR
jgi:hypothetical protein